MSVRSIVTTVKGIQRHLAGLLAGADTLSNERTRLLKTHEPPFGAPTGAWQCAPHEDDRTDNRGFSRDPRAPDGGPA